MTTTPTDSPLRVSVDASALAYPKRTGIGRYLESMLPRLVELGGKDTHFRLFAGRPLCEPTAVALVRGGRISARTVTTPSLFAWQQLAMGLQMRSFRPHVHFAPDGLLPLGLRCPAVGVIHDMIWKRVPGTARFHVRLAFGIRQGAGLKALNVAFADSQATRSDLLQDYGTAAEKVRVRHLGIDPLLFHPATDGERDAARSFRERMGLHAPYLLTVGNLMPHKNLNVVIEALALAYEQDREPPCIAIVGHGDPSSLLARLPGRFPSDRIRCLGFVSEPDLRMAYRCAEAMIFPSLYEGFGFPVLEAMAGGVPVIHSGRTSVGEIAGDAGIEFNPEDPASLLEALSRLEKEAGLREDLVQRGLERSKMFSWDACAEEVWKALNEAAQSAS